LYDLHPTGNDLAPAHRGTVMAADFTPDGKKLITVGDDGDINIWDLAKAGKLERSLPASPSLRAAAIAPTGNWVAVGDRQGKVRVFDIVTDAPRLEFQQETTVTALAFSADGMSVASGGTDGKIALWVIPDNGEGRRRTTLPGHTGPVYSLAFSPHGEQLASSGWDGKVIVQDLDSATTLHTLTPHSDGTWAVEFTPCGLMLVTTGQDGRVTMWDTANGKEVQSLTHHKGAVHTARFGKRGALLATGGRDGTVRVWPTDCK
jgi:WD40 repeat protein